MSNQKILAIDLDDTLFCDDKSISQGNIDALNELLNQGHVLAVDTGRPTHVMQKLLSGYKLFDRNNVFLLGFQGAMGLDVTQNKVIYSHYLDGSAAIKLLTYAFNAGLSTIAFEFGKMYSFRDDSNVEEYRKLSKEPIIIIDNPNNLVGHNLIKIMIIDFENTDILHQFENKHKAEMDCFFNSMFSNVAFLEYVGIGAGKGKGLQELAKRLGISMDDTVACGDERNDISMISIAGIGVAVKNARDELKAVADYITENDNNNDAVAEVINKFIL